MFIGIDIGNTRAQIGFFKEDSPLPFHITPLSTGRERFGNEMEILLGEKISEYSGKHGPLSGAAFSSVVPELSREVSALFRNSLKSPILEISHTCRLNIVIDYDDPGRLGVDRIVNAEAAYTDYGGDTVIVDLGTAVTFCLVKGKRFEGGVIAPGIEISGRALHREAARLPHIEFGKPERLVSKNTEDAIRSGLYYGWVSMVEGIFSKIEQNYREKFKLVLTGGNARVISEGLTGEFHLDEALTMKGIKYIYDQNK